MASQGKFGDFYPSGMQVTACCIHALLMIVTFTKYLHKNFSVPVLPSALHSKCLMFTVTTVGDLSSRPTAAAALKEETLIGLSVEFSNERDHKCGRSEPTDA